MLRQKSKLLINVLRLKEISLMTGFSVIGIFFTDHTIWTQLVILKTIISIFAYVVNIYALNSLADYSFDKHSDRLNTVSKVSQTQYLLIFSTSLLVYLILSFSIHPSNTLFYLLGLFLWILYYLPPFRFKSTFLIGTFIHLIAGTIHFHMGYTAFATFSVDSWYISLFFGLLLASGHFHHEILDFQDDKQAGISTTTVRIGTHKSQVLRSFTLGIAAGLWTILFYLQAISGNTYLIFSIPTIILLLFSVYYKDRNVRFYQRISRTIFLIAGIIYFCNRLFSI